MKKISLLLIISLLLNIVLCGSINASSEIDTDKMSTALLELVEQSEMSAMIEVGIFVKELNHDVVASAFAEKSVIPLTSLKKKENVNNINLNEQIRASREVYAGLYSRHNNKVAKSLNISTEQISYISHYSPLIISTLSVANIRNITKSSDVVFIDIYYRATHSDVLSANSTVDDDLAMQICRIDEVKEEYGLTGWKVNVGIADMGIPSSSELSNAGINCPSSHLYGNRNGDHPIHIGKIIHNVAPQAELFFAGGENLGVVECIEWLLDQEAMVINVSMSVGGTLNTYTSYSRWMDHVSYQHFSMIVAASGNREGREDIGCYDLQMGYNVITIGQLNCRNTLSYSDDTMGIAQYNIESNAPFKPDLSGSYGDTSSSTALVTGGIALLLEEFPLMRTSAGTVKALLTASVNRESPHRYVPEDRDDSCVSFMQVGAGLFDAYNFITNAMDNSYYENIINTTTVQDVISLPAGKNVRLSLAYVQPITVSTTDHGYTGSGTSNNIVNYQLVVIKQGVIQPVATSYTDNNLEIVDFNTGTGGNFTIRIIAETGSNVDVVYSVAYDIY